ncbi:hypothetical protein BJX62DRAFT_234827 [Aspergillus germanicus]
MTTSHYTYTFFRIAKDNDIAYQLKTDGRETFVCAATLKEDNLSESQVTQESIWVGQLALRGPQSLEDFILPEEAGQWKPTEEVGDIECWQMLSLFTHPDHCGLGLGKALCWEALKYLASYRASPSKVWVRLMVKPENHATVSLYHGLGFAEAGKCTLAEALVANGDEDLLPEDISGEKYSSRSGLIMMLEICRS